MNKTTDYQTFLANKRHSANDAGFDATYFPAIAFDFQRAIIERSVKKGRCAIFADTGLGKTLIEIAIAANIIEKTNKQLLLNLKDAPTRFLHEGISQSFNFAEMEMAA